MAITIQTRGNRMLFALTCWISCLYLAPVFSAIICRLVLLYQLYCDFLAAWSKKPTQKLNNIQEESAGLPRIKNKDIVYSYLSTANSIGSSRPADSSLSCLINTMRKFLSPDVEQSGGQGSVPYYSMG